MPAGNLDFIEGTYMRAADWNVFPRGTWVPADLEDPSDYDLYVREYKFARPEDLLHPQITIHAWQPTPGMWVARVAGCLKPPLHPVSSLRQASRNAIRRYTKARDWLKTKIPRPPPQS
jgi:hypothetical protein